MQAGIIRPGLASQIVTRVTDNSLPSGKTIAAQHGRHERWGRLVKRMGIGGHLANTA